MTYRDRAKENCLGHPDTFHPITQWRLEFRDTVTGPNAWQPLTNITLGTSSFILDQPLGPSNRFYRGVWVP